MDLTLPKLGEGADSGVVVNVFVKEGDTVARDQTIIELENEKAVASIPATAGGVVARVHVKAGDKISAGQRILTLVGSAVPSAAAPTGGKPESAASRQVPAPAPEVAEAVETAAELETAAPVVAPVAAPSLRRMARELGLDLARVRGRGPGGRIEIGDVRAYLQRLQASAAPAKLAPAAAVVPAKPVAEPVDFSKWGPVTRKAITSLRGVIARRMWESWHAVPHVTQFDDADFTRLNDLRKKYAAAYAAKGAKLTLTPLVLKAVAATLKQHPMFNASLDEVANEIVLKEYVHLGIAVDTGQGLIVPVIRDVDRKSVFELAKELEVLAQKARDRKISSDELKGGSFTISNQGAIGGAHFTPIVNKPEVAILGLGRGAMKPVVRDGTIEARMLTPLAVSYDHRVIDGGSAARFMVDLVAALQDFSEDEVKL